ncbi:MAG: MobQ family relaxase [Angelakisella sp.]|nr:MobQ family relaxase [Angelakisella sp.]
MAIYSLQCKVIGKGQKKSDGTISLRTVVAAAAYRAGEKLRNLIDGKSYDFTKKQGIVHSEIILPQGAPARYHNRQTLWNEVEAMEKRHDAQFCRELVLALPVELFQEENIRLVRHYVQRHFVDKGMCADISFHAPDPRRGGQKNPHAHILLTMRVLESGRFGKKNRVWNQKDTLVEWRELWASVCNDQLAQKGIDARIDHRSLKAQGLDRQPTIHLGVEAAALERRGIRTAKGDINRSVRAHNAALECGVESPGLLSGISKLWQRAADMRSRKAPMQENGTPNKTSVDRETSPTDVQRRTYTLQSNVVRQGSDPAPEKEGKDALRGDVGSKKRLHQQGQKADPRGKASREPASEKSHRTSIRERLNAWLHKDNSRVPTNLGAAKYDIKVMSSMLNIMSENGIDSYTDLELKLSDVSGKITNLISELRENRRLLGVLRSGHEAGEKAQLHRSVLKDIEQAYGTLLRCQANKAYADKYSKTIFKENYYKKFGDKIEAYHKAVKQLQAAGLYENMTPDQLRQPMEYQKEQLRIAHQKYLWAVGQLEATGFNVSSPELMQKAIEKLTNRNDIVKQELSKNRRKQYQWQRIKQQVDNIMDGRRPKEPTR